MTEQEWLARCVEAERKLAVAEEQALFLNMKYQHMYDQVQGLVGGMAEFKRIINDRLGKGFEDEVRALNAKVAEASRTAGNAHDGMMENTCAIDDIRKGRQP